MSSCLRLTQYIVFILSILLTAVSVSAQTKDKSLFIAQQGGFVNIPDGAYIQGSRAFGGIQPDYYIDLNEPDLATFLETVQTVTKSSYANRLLNQFGLKNLDRNKKIEIVTALIQKALPEKSYTAPAYLKILEEFRLQNLDITLGSYLRCAAGVCRENALLTHFALKAAGIENEFVYIHASQEGALPEDHAVVTIQDKDGRWIIDPYNSNFHGKNFDDLIRSNKNLNESVRFARFVSKEIAQTKKDVPVKIIRVNQYPTFWLPKVQCTALFAL